MLRLLRNRYALTRTYTSVSDLYIPQQNVLNAQESNQKLLELVQNRQYAAADRLRLLLVQHDIPIRHHVTYESVALAMLRFKADDFRGFSAWLSLTPDKDDLHTDEGLLSSSLPRPYTTLRHALFEAGSPAARVPVIYHFGLIIASKGYEDIVLRHVLPFLTVFASPEKGVRFLCEFETACSLYKDKSPFVRRRGSSSYASKLRERSLKICCYAGWADEAANLLRESAHLRISAGVREMVQRMQNK